MEAASPSRQLPGDKAQRIVDAMRTSVGLRGTTGSTFDHVARAAGVSRGLLHYYFGTKERLLVEVVRRDCDLRMQRLSETVTGVDGADALLGALVQSLNETIAESPEFFVILLELHTLARRNEEIAAELAELHRRVREHLAALLEQAPDEKNSVARVTRTLPRRSSPRRSGQLLGRAFGQGRGPVDGNIGSGPLLALHLPSLTDPAPPWRAARTGAAMTDGGKFGAGLVHSTR
jgi:AcrR family transcriptional regulator